MIPEFPKLKKLELSDKKDIERFTHKMPPYSDFNFANMWSWDIHGDIKIAQLNKNLIVFFRDYITNEHFFMFIGTNMIPETATELIAFSRKNHGTSKLKLIPEEGAHILEKSGFVIESVRGAFDYIYSVAHLAKMDCWPGSGISKRIRQFVKLYPDYSIQCSSIKNIDKSDCLKIFKKWVKNKGHADHFELNELKAFERFLQINDRNIEAVLLRVNDVLVGFTAYEVLPNNCAISHFAKSDAEFHAGAGDLLNWEEAKQLLGKGVSYYNWEQDLGIPGLRYSKEKYNPSLFMKKFIVSKK